MKIAHLSDTHLGYKAFNFTDPATGRNQRTQDFDDALAMVVDKILEASVDMVIHSGDVFHHVRPTWLAIHHFVTQMQRIERAGIPLVVIGGNHDTPRARIGGSVYDVLKVALTRSHIIADYVDAKLEFDEVAVHAVPWGALTNKELTASWIHETKPTVLVSHGTTPGIVPHVGREDHSEQLIDINLADPDYAYVALGHIHHAQQISSNTWYAGSPERCGWSDIKNDPGFLLIEDWRPRHVAIDARPMMDLGELDITELTDDQAISQLVEACPLNDRALVRFTLTTQWKRRTYGIEREVRSLAPVWHVDFKNSDLSTQIADIKELNFPKDLTLPELFKEFVKTRGAAYPPGFEESFTRMGLEAMADAEREEFEP